MISINPFKPYIYGFVALMFLAVCGTAYFYKNSYEKDKAKVLSMQNERDNALSMVEAQKKQLALKDKELAVLEATNQYRMEEINKMEKQKEVNDDLLQKALKQNRAWSDSSVPDQLRKHFQTLQND